MTYPQTDAAEDSPVGRIGVLLIGTRGPAGCGEVQLSIRGGRETFFAYSDHPVPQGATVLVVEAAPYRRVTVVPWVDPPGPPD
jgi:hypothetical protein